jgi:hypothetical protein
MIDGLWSVQFQGPQAHAGGVVVLVGGRVLGGDSGFAYVGSYELSGETLRAKVTVKNFDPTVSNVFGIAGSFDLLLEAKVQGDSMTGTGALASSPTARMTLRLTKHSGL